MLLLQSSNNLLFNNIISIIVHILYWKLLKHVKFSKSAIFYVILNRVLHFTRKQSLILHKNVYFSVIRANFHDFKFRNFLNINYRTFTQHLEPFIRQAQFSVISTRFAQNLKILNISIKCYSRLLSRYFGIIIIEIHLIQFLIIRVILNSSKFNKFRVFAFICF